MGGLWRPPAAPGGHASFPGRPSPLSSSGCGTYASGFWDARRGRSKQERNMKVFFREEG